MNQGWKGRAVPMWAVATLAIPSCASWITEARRLTHAKFLLAEAIVGAADDRAAAHGIRPLTAVSPQADPRIGAMDAQRRQLTVMFCDLVGSTELSAQLDPEDMNEVIGAYLRACAECIEGAGGYVARYTGDGALAYFGYPTAHEDDPERAIHAALMLRDATLGITTPLGAPLSVRSGIATGLVVVGDLIGAGAAAERLVVGETPNLAARLQAVAARSSVVVADSTRRLAGDLFDFRDLGQLELKGFAPRESAWEVVGPSPLAHRLGARRRSQDGAIFGRDADLDFVLERWGWCVDGGGQIVGVVGEPGIGKSRLVHEIRGVTAREPRVWLEGGGAQVFRNTPFYAISQMIRRRLGRGTRLSDAECLDRLERLLRASGMDVGEALPLVADLLGVATPDSHTPLTLGADERRARLISTLTQWLLATAARWPTLMVIEDLHWVDPSTLELLDLVVERAPAARLMVLYSSREVDDARWSGSPRHERALLGRLDPASVRNLAVAAGNRDMPADLLDDVISRAQGVPLFAEELTRLLVERGDRILDHEIPNTLSDLLLARLDQLGPTKTVAQMAAVLGGEFSAELLGALSGLATPELALALDRLLLADMIVVVEHGAEKGYAFKHSLIQDAAYDALLRSQRRGLHGRAARIIAESFPELTMARPEVLAHHWTMAGEMNLALAAWREASRSAIARRAYKEARAALERALAIISDLPATAEPGGLELELQSALAGVLQITEGYSTPPAMAATARARRLAERGGDLEKQFAHAAGDWMAASSGGDYDTANRLANQLLPLAHTQGSPQSLGAAFMILMTSRYRVGRLIEAEEAFHTGRTYFAAAEFRRRPGAVPQTFGNAAIVAWLMGRTDEARRRIDGAFDLACEDNPYETAFANYMAAMQGVIMGDHAAAGEMADISIRLSDEHGYPQFAATSRIVRGRATAALGRPVDGIALIQEGLAAMDGTRSRAGLSMYLTWLSEAQALHGALPEALSTMEAALEANPRELFFRPESLRLRGHLLSRMGDMDGAAASYGDAVALAKETGASRFHARATASLQALGAAAES